MPGWYGYRIGSSGIISDGQIHRGAQGRHALITRSGRLLGQTLAGLVNFFNPSLIVVGGGVARAGDAYLATNREAIHSSSAPLATRDLEVRLSALDDKAGVMGAATVVLDQLFSAEQLSHWIDRGQPAGMQIAAA